MFYLFRVCCACCVLCVYFHYFIFVVFIKGKRSKKCRLRKKKEDDDYDGLCQSYSHSFCDSRGHDSKWIKEEHFPSTQQQQHFCPGTANTGSVLGYYCKKRKLPARGDIPPHLIRILYKVFLPLHNLTVFPSHYYVFSITLL